MLLEEEWGGGGLLWGYKTGPATDGVEVRLKVRVFTHMVCLCVRGGLCVCV